MAGQSVLAAARAALGGALRIKRYSASTRRSAFRRTLLAGMHCRCALTYATQWIGDAKPPATLEGEAAGGGVDDPLMRHKSSESMLAEYAATTRRP